MRRSVARIASGILAECAGHLSSCSCSLPSRPQMRFPPTTSHPIAPSSPAHLPRARPEAPATDRVPPAARRVSARAKPTPIARRPERRPSVCPFASASSAATPVASPTCPSSKANRTPRASAPRASRRSPSCVPIRHRSVRAAPMAVVQQVDERRGRSRCYSCSGCAAYADSSASSASSSASSSSSGRRSSGISSKRSLPSATSSDTR